MCDRVKVSDPQQQSLDEDEVLIKLMDAAEEFTTGLVFELDLHFSEV